MIGRLFKLFLGLSLLAVIGVGIAGVMIYKRLEPNLPDIDALNDVELHVPLLVYSNDGKLLAEFGEKRREQLLIEDTPQAIIDAVISAEDDRFYEHPGVDYQGLLRAGINLIKTGTKGQGGSTITMQVARNIYLSPEKTYLRKINEILLALKIERQISKASILELYLNIPYLGNRAYGVASAAKVYYGKQVDELTLPEIAMIAGLPKAPSRYNPIVNPERAQIRRNYVLRRMFELGKITQQEFQQALASPVTATLHRTPSEVEASYVSEMARAQMIAWLGPQAYTGGYKVYTTINSEHQEAANAALQQALLDYEKRHGFRLPGKMSPEDAQTQESIDIQLAELPAHGNLQPALVIATDSEAAYAVLIGGEQVTIGFDQLQWASPRSEDDDEKPALTTPGEILSTLDIIYVVQDDNGVYSLGQMPEVEGAFVSLSPQSGKVMALVGGFDFYRSKFNRITQAYRQPGSNFKPFIYSAALEYGDTPASIYNDTPVVLEDSVLEDEWRPRNYSGRFFGPTRLREALVKSRNLVSIRVLQELGIPRAVRYAERFNFEERSLPRNLSLALGSGDMTPLQLASAYMIFANGGYAIQPRFIERIEDSAGNIVYQAAVVQRCENEEECAAVNEQNQGVTSPENVAVVDDSGEEDKLLEINAVAKDDQKFKGIPNAPLVVAAERVIDERNAYIMQSILGEVIDRGTARRAKALGRSDLAGKTGTTNDLYDAWFTGFNSQLVATAWVGYDEQQSMGPKESGGRAALPMWIDYMAVALEGVPEDTALQPEGIATVRIDRKTGKLATPGADGSYFEYFREENIPTEYAEPYANVQPAVVTPVLAEPVNSRVQATEQQVRPATTQLQPAQPTVVVQPRPKPAAQKKEVDSLF